MILTRQALVNPVAVIVAVLLVLLFGAIGLTRLPIQMIPTVERPIIQINTNWRAAAPQEVESQILEPQEDALRGLAGLKRMETTASRGSASINLEFEVGVELERALIEVMNRMNRVPRYPPDTDEPIIYAGRGEFGSAIAWFSLRALPGSGVDIAQFQDFAEDVIQARIERVAGIADSAAFGGRPSEVRITFDPYQAAAYNIDILNIARLAGNNTDASGGFSDVGRREYTVRYNGQYDLDEFAGMVLAWRDGQPVRLSDVATVERTLMDSSGTLSQNGGPSIAINAQADSGVNVLAVMEDLKRVVAELDAGPARRAGLFIEQDYDETVYIKQSIRMLRWNLLAGIALAVAILWWFMRRWRATVIVSLAIPVSLFLAFAALYISGRTLNIISLAGLAFAMGMVMDAAIVVLENIVRLREQGRQGEDAAHAGTEQVWAALVASTATTVAIFLPILFIKDIAGQLFSDLAFTLATAVLTSLLIAITIVPTAAAAWLKGSSRTDPHASWWDSGAANIMRATDTPARRFGWIGGLLLLGVLLTVWLRPQADYLPEGKQNFAFGFILPPPGQSHETSRREFVDVVNERIGRHLRGEAQPAAANFFMGVFGSFGFMGGEAEHRGELDALLEVLNGEVFSGFPDTLAFISRAAIFEGLGASRAIDVNIQSRDIEAMFEAANKGMQAIAEHLPEAQVRPVPGLEFAQPELSLLPRERRLAEVGWSRQDMASIVRALGDGMYVGDYFDGEKSYNMILRANEWDTPESLGATPVVTPRQGVVPLSDLVQLQRTAGPSQLLRVDRRRTVTLQVTPPEISLEQTLAILREHVEPVIRAQLPADGDVTYYGSADALAGALRSMGGSFALAIAILYLLMSGLFRSFTDSLLVLMALPLATVGGVLGLRLTNLFTFQPMDLLTMIGFITLLGLVVNNAILLVHQTRMAEREGAGRRQAVRDAVRIRMRPILMSTLTSLFGMLPLLLVPGAGTELYRGLAAVIVGGMTVSTLFTLILLPSLLRMGERHHLPALPSGGGLEQQQYAQRREE